MRFNARVAVWTALVACSAPIFGGGRETGLLYYEQGGQIVFTNTASRSDVRPVPGFERVYEAARRGDALPATVYDTFIERVAAEFSLSPALIKAVALVESGFDPHAESPKGAQGLMQLMPATAREYGVRDAFDPLQNLRAGAAHLRRLLDRYDGDLTLTLAAYNAGEGAVRRHGGVPAYRETRDYVRKVHGHLGSAPKRAGRPAAKRSEPARLVQSEDGSIKLVN